MAGLAPVILRLTDGVSLVVLDGRLIVAEHRFTVTGCHGVEEVRIMAEKANDRWAEFVAQMQELAAQSMMVVGSRDWSRDDVHQR